LEIVESLIKFLHIIVSIILILAVLLQPGKSGDLGSMFGGGSSESVFGSSGAVPFLAKLTRILGIVFFVTSLSLGYFEIRGGSSSVLKDVGASAVIVDEVTDGGTVGTSQAIADPEIVDEAAKLDETTKLGEGSEPPQTEETN